MRADRRGLPLIAAGLLCVAAAAALTCYNMWDDARAAAVSRTAVDSLLPIVDEHVAEKLAADPIEAAEDAITEAYLINVGAYIDMPVEVIDGEAYVGLLSIPALSLELPVLSEWSYDGLRAAPCRYAGSAYMGDLVICAHNYTYHFGRLRELSAGDEVLLVDMSGEIFRYEVAEILTLEPTAVSEMLRSEYDLTLYTCTLGGAARVTVRCRSFS